MADITYERYGRAVAELEDLRAELQLEFARHVASIAVMRQIARGELPPRRLIVADDAPTWRIMTDEEAAAENPLNEPWEGAEPAAVEVGTRLPDDLAAEGLIAPPKSDEPADASEGRTNHK